MSVRPLVNVSAPPASKCETFWLGGVGVRVTLGRGDKNGRSWARPASRRGSVHPSALQAALALKVSGGAGGGGIRAW